MKYTTIDFLKIWNVEAHENEPNYVPQSFLKIQQISVYLRNLFCDISVTTDY